eukprot:6172785-Prymnesium_polylepis.1
MRPTAITRPAHRPCTPSDVWYASSPPSGSPTPKKLTKFIIAGMRSGAPRPKSVCWLQPQARLASTE